MKTTEQILFEYIDSIGECQNKNIHIINTSDEFPVFKGDRKYRIYHSDGYCFDIERYRDYIKNEIEYVFFAEWDGFKNIDIEQAVLLIRKMDQ